MGPQHLPVQVQKGAFRVVFAGILLHEFHIVPVGNEADVLAVMLAGVDKAQPLRDLPNFRFFQLPQGEDRAGELLLGEHIEHIALILAQIKGLFQQIPA